jgi:hypothetical protein
MQRGRWSILVMRSRGGVKGGLVWGDEKWDDKWAFIMGERLLFTCRRPLITGLSQTGISKFTRILII